MPVDRDLRKRPSSQAGLGTLFLSGSLTGLTDGELVDAFLDHAEPQLAFSMIVERHGGMVLRVCRSILRNEADAEDALQVTFLVLARKAPSLRNRASLAAWLHAVATRTANAARRNSARRRFIEANAAVPSETNAPETNDDLREHIQNEVARLPERLREVVVLREFEGLSEGEAAGQIGCAEGTVKSRLFRAKKRLRSRLEARGWDATAILAPSTLPLPLPTNAVEAISLLSMSEGPSIPARLTIWRSIVLRGMLMKNVPLIVTTGILLIAIPLASSAYLAKAGNQDKPKPAERQTKETKSQEQVANQYATLAKARLALAESIYKARVNHSNKGLVSAERVAQADDSLLAARFDFAEDPREKILLLRERLKLASRFEDAARESLERGLISQAEADQAMLHRLAIATQLAKEQMAKPADPELLRRAESRYADDLRSFINEFETSEYNDTVESLLSVTIQLPKREKWTLHEFLKACRVACQGTYSPGVAIEGRLSALVNAGVSLESPVVCPEGPRKLGDYLKTVLEPLGLKVSTKKSHFILIEGDGPKKSADEDSGLNFSIEGPRTR